MRWRDDPPNLPRRDAGLGVTDEGPELVLYDAKHIKRIEMEVSEKETAIDLSDARAHVLEKPWEVRQYRMGTRAFFESAHELWKDGHLKFDEPVVGSPQPRLLLEKALRFLFARR